MENESKPGPKPVYGAKMILTRVNLPQSLIDKAREIGSGNFSAGVRIAVSQTDAAVSLETPQAQHPDEPGQQS